MSRVIEAKAVISAQDKTGSVFDSIAKKFRGVAKDAKAFANIKPPKLSGDFFEGELKRLKLTQRELRGVQKEFKALDKSIRDVGPMHPAHYMREIDRWRGRTLSHWREVKSSTEEAHKAQEKFAAHEKEMHRFRHGLRHTAAHIVGLGAAGGVGYAVARGVHSTAESAAQRGRAFTRYEMMGLTEAEQQEGQNIASAIGSKFPSLSRTEVLDYLRANASRLGSWERSKEVAEPYARALIANKLSGGTDHEMEQIVRALEGMGKANTAGQITEGLNAFARAKAANPDYTGEQFRSDMAAASSSKYGLSKDYMENVFPILASHTTGFGNKLSTGLSALVGGRMTKTSKAALAQAGLIKDGKLVDEPEYIANNFEWTQKHVRPLLEKDGVHFGEEMSENDKAKVVSRLAKWFSARNAADLIATNLLDAPLVEKARHRQTKKLEDMDQLQTRDPFLAWEGMVTQMKDAATAFVKLGPVVDSLNVASSAFANITKTIETGELPRSKDETTFWGAIADGPRLRAAEDPSDFSYREELGRRLQEAEQKLQPGYGLNERDTAVWRLKKFQLDQGKYAFANQQSMPQIFTDEEIERMQEIDREHRRGMALSEMQPERSGGIPLPRSRPKEADAGAMPPVQPLDNAPQKVDVSVQGEVAGEAKISIAVEASELLKATVSKLENAMKLIGNLRSNGNGPGSLGRSSPDASAPAPTSVPPALRSK
ncbi:MULTISPECIES: hypothetical protein [unclassified Bradyrhizobium]|uniref:hypothetical protein n=1 Tax=unclassified Bradyrhizobium TaxID=2631580 RepID=UPI0028EEB6B1|nr:MULTISPECIES: hypothetical protein [unclassified Bradyrhizobium]